MGLVDHLLGEAPPLVGYRFAAVLLPGMIPMIAPVDLRFQSVDGLKAERSLDRKEDNVLVPGVSRGTLTFKRGMPALPTPLQAVHLVEQAFWDEKLLRTEVLVATLSDTPIPYPTKAWIVTGAHLTSIEWGGLNATSNDVLLESMSYSYSRIIPLPI